MRQWTIQARKQQALLIHNWKPWLKGGVKTLEGKKISCMNAYKHGGYSAETKASAKALTELGQLFDQLQLLV